MIPLVGFIIYKNTKIKKMLLVWIIPVIIIPLFWPAYAFYKNQLNLWFNGLYFQTHRGAQTLFEVIKYNFQYDPYLVIFRYNWYCFLYNKKRFIYFTMGRAISCILIRCRVCFIWHIIPLFPLFCIAAVLDLFMNCLYL